MNAKAFDCFKEDGMWLKGNLHSHTTRSDGLAEPDELVNWYQKNGYDFLAITDHDTITDVAPFEQEPMLVIPGIDFGYSPAEEPGFVLDMLGINIDKIPDFLDPEGKNHIVNDPSISPQRIIDAINAAGGIAIMCHPYFMINMTEPYLKYHSYIGLEAYNYVCEELCGRGNHEIYWDTMLYRGKKLLGFASDDSHKPQFGYAWIEVKAKEKTIPAVMEAIKAGKFYATTGIKIIDVTFVNGTVKITFDRPCDVVMQPFGGYIDRAYSNQVELVDGKPQFSVERKIPPNTKWFRIELIDEHGKKAYTNPVWLKD